MGTWPRTVAKPSALNPSSAVSFTFAPASRRIRADSTSPTRAANSRAVNPAAAAPDARVPGRRFAAFTAVRALRSAPLPVSSRTISTCRSDAAHINAVCWRDASLALTSAPAATSRFTTSALPVQEATISGVSRPWAVAFGSAPAASSVSTMGALPFVQARSSGVTPRSLAAPTSAPARSSLSTSARSS